MEWDHEIDLSTRKMTTRLIIERALARGWRVCGFKTVKPLLLLQVPGRQKPVAIYSASPAQMSYTAVKIAKDKFVTNAILGTAGLPVPAEMLVLVDGSDVSEVEAFIQQYGSTVLKPLDASHGKGITVNINSKEVYDKALQAARPYTKQSRLVLQEQLSGVDVRVVCIDYQYVDAISRQPASVLGDGRHTVRELIELTNESDERGENYRARLNRIPLDKAEAYLGTEALGRVPGMGEQVQVIGVSNVGMGGVRKNMHQHIPQVLKDMAIAAARELNLPVCGVDFMVNREPQSNDSIEELNPRIIEVNECPMLTMYEDLQSAEQQAVIDRYLDYVASAL